jgi:hypothetical protein
MTIRTEHLVFVRENALEIQGTPRGPSIELKNSARDVKR